MIKKYSILILITFFINNSLNSAGTNSDDQDPTWKRGNEDLSHMKGKNSNFKRGVDALNQAKKYDKKGKTDKSIKRFKKMFKECTIHSFEPGDSECEQMRVNHKNDNSVYINNVGVGEKRNS